VIQEIDLEGNAYVDLGNEDIYFFFASVENGDPWVGIMTRTKDEDSIISSYGPMSSQSVTSSSGVVYKISCSVN
jgi:hypothetical protein